ncbi:MAG: pesticidal protein Cry15Aa [Verrucomicrobia bacterium]|nr:pesticidal protein Cry15Aa [Verrucomicrobiota bacterium]
MKKIFLTLALTFSFALAAEAPQGWELGFFERFDTANPILYPNPESHFYCPVQKKEVPWEGEHTFNPGAVVRHGTVYLFYRAEDNFSQGIGQHTSRLGLAESFDGFHFKQKTLPIFFPDEDSQTAHEWPGGCEDPRLVETEDGMYVMTYTQWNRKVAVLGVATSTDLMHWTKHGYVFDHAHEGKFGRQWSKSGSIVCRLEGDRLIATQIQGKYWMFWGEGTVHLATSDDLISWQPLVDHSGKPLVILAPRPGKFDSALVESGPPALLTQKGIVLIYNGKNAAENGDPTIGPGAYSAGQVLFEAHDPTQILTRTEECFFRPERPYETRGQYVDGTVFVQGLVHHQGRWLLYYGAADSVAGVAYSNK